MKFTKADWQYVMSQDPTIADEDLGSIETIFTHIKDADHHALINSLLVLINNKYEEGYQDEMYYLGDHDLEKASGRFGDEYNG